jgi:hypothetical protein
MNPRLPEPRGPLSETVIAALAGGRPLRAGQGGPGGDAVGAPLEQDLQLALYVCYELHYWGFEGVDPGWEWDPDLLRLRRSMEDAFLAAVNAGVPGGEDVDATLAGLLVEYVGADGVSHHFLRAGQLWQLREYLAHRSIYHLKEADPHAWVIPRLRGQAKAALVAVEFDEFGGGHGDRMHSKLFADLMDGAGLDSRYGHYLDLVPAETLATVNLMSMFGLHRALRGALVGHFAAAEISTAPNADRMARALDRLEAGPACTRFFTEHVEADAVHEQIMRRDVIGDLLDREPELAADVVLGIQATEHLEDRLGRHLLDRWRAGRTSLRRPLDA